jgi:hypothetical protein
VEKMSEMLMMKRRVLASFSLFHESDKNVAKQTLESRFSVGFRHNPHLSVPDWDMTTDITILLALDAELVEASMDPRVLDESNLWKVVNYD